MILPYGLRQEEPGVLKLILDTKQVIPTVKKIKTYIHKEENLIYNYFFTSLQSSDSLLFGNRGYGIFSHPSKQDVLSNIYFNNNPAEQAPMTSLAWKKTQKVIFG